MQVVDSMLVIHNLDEKTSQLFDVKLLDYFKGVVHEVAEVEMELANKGLFLSDLIMKDNDGSYDGGGLKNI
jgi:hypothetical protein